jgi:two-component system LytT family response regulator
MPTAIIIDDSARDRDLLRGLLRQHPDVRIVAECASGAEGMDAIALHRPQLVFLDVEMPVMSGLQMLAQMKERDFGVIFTSAHSEYGVQAIRMAALDYLLKPVKAHELAEAMDRFRRSTDPRTLGEQFRVLDAYSLSSKPAKRPLAVPVGKPDSRTLEFIDVEDVAYCTSAGADASGGRGEYTTLHLCNGRQLVVSEVLKHYERLLGPFGFVRVSRSHVINTALMASYVPRDRCVVLRIGNATVPITVKDTYRNGFEAAMMR